MQQNQFGIKPPAAPKKIIINLGTTRLELKRNGHSGYVLVKSNGFDGSHTSAPKKFSAQIGSASITIDQDTGRVAIDSECPCNVTYVQGDTLYVYAGQVPNGYSRRKHQEQDMSSMLDHMFDPAVAFRAPQPA
jgi:hypothetical protein